MIIALLLRARDAKRRAHAQGSTFLNQDLFAVDTLTDLLCNFRRLFKRHAGQYHTELFAADAPGNIFSAQGTGNQPRSMGQHLITRLVPEPVINALKAVKIDLDDRERQRLLFTLLRQYFRPLKQRPTIIQPGQRVVPGLPLQRILQRIHITDHAPDHQP